MDDFIASIYYFKDPGPQNTERTLELSKRRAAELKLKNILVASTTGKTGVLASKIFKGYNLIVVSHSTGFAKPDYQEMTEENRKKILKEGAKILTCQHAFGGVGRAVRKKFGTYETEEIIANALRILGEGFKVACEITLMTADAGLIRTDEKAIAIGGTDRGADTAIVVLPSNSQTFFDMKVFEIICKPLAPRF
ncbi:MAG: pyruvate kinase alpha/beta domain-containing protein [Acidobacteriota bacterium]